MNEPRRLLQAGGAAERALLASARTDEPPEGTDRRTLSAVQGFIAIGATGPDPGSAGATGALKLSALAKVGLLALVGAGAVGGGVLAYRHRASPSVAVAAAPAPATAPASAPTAPAAAVPASAPTESSLAAEIRVLDQARAALEARQPAAARQALDEHARRFPRGHLQPEAQVLELNLLVREGKRAPATDLAARLLASEPYRAYQHRIRSLLRELDE